MNARESKLENPRAEIDTIDGEILRLLNRRAEIALRVGEAKSQNDASLCDPSRELGVLARVRDANAGPFDDQSVTNIFQRIIDESLHLQQVTYQKQAAEADGAISLASSSRVAFLGERGTFSEEAALAILGENCTAVSFPTFDELFSAVANGQADYVLAPLENSLIGSVRRCVDLLLASPLQIVSEVVLPVSHCLVAPQNATIETIWSVESHPAALSQCERFFAAHPHLKRIVADDTAGAVKRTIESGDATRGAVGSRRAAEIYGGKILREHLEDHSENYTRFVLLSSESDENASGSKVSIVLRLKNRPGSLHNALRPFVRRGIDLLKIESLPIRESPEEFNFYLDLRAPSVEAELDGALDEVASEVVNARFLGRYSTKKL